MEQLRKVLFGIIAVIRDNLRFADAQNLKLFQGIFYGDHIRLVSSPGFEYSLYDFRFPIPGLYPSILSLDSIHRNSIHQISLENNKEDNHRKK